MTERIFIRQFNQDSWQWRILSQDGLWLGDSSEGDLETLNKVVADREIPTCLIVPGWKAIARSMPVGSSEKKHLNKLLPYEMEEQLIDSVDNLHFCFGNIENEQVNLVYLDTDQLQSTLEALSAQGCDVQHVCPDYLLMAQDECAGVILLEDEQIIARFSDGNGFAIEINIATLVLESLQDKLLLEDSSLRLVANSAEALEIVKSCLPDAWLGEHGPSFEEQLGNYWDVIDPHSLARSINLRSGQFARQLPFARWWRLWKTSTFAIAASFIFALAVTFGEYLQARSEGKQIKQEIERVYLQAVPDGRKGDEENRLKSLLEGSGSKGQQPTNLMTLLSGLAKSMDKQEDIQLSNFRYNGDQREMQINIEVKGLGELSQFRELLASNGLQSGSPRTSRQGDIYQANMKITENAR